MVAPQLGVEVNDTSQDNDPSQDEKNMTPWLDWLESSGFENLWDDENR